MKIPKRTFLYRDVIDLLWEERWGSDASRSAYLAHLKVLKRTGLPSAKNPGQGHKIDYNFFDLMELRLALEFRYSGISIKHAGPFLIENRYQLRRAITHAVTKYEESFSTFSINGKPRQLQGYFLELRLGYFDKPACKKGRHELRYVVPILRSAAKIAEVLDSLGRQRCSTTFIALSEIAIALIPRIDALPI